MKRFFIVRDVKLAMHKITTNSFLVKLSCLIIVTTLVISYSVFKKQSKTSTIVFVGDLLLDRGVRNRIVHLGVDNLFSNSIDSVFMNTDIVVANLECPATKIKEPINKKFIFRAEPEWLSILKNHGITHLTMANNHSMDQGRRGLVDTYDNILKSNLIPLGFGKNHKKACEPQLIVKYPRKVYVLSSLQVPSENWTYLEDKVCVCEDSFNVIAKKIKKLKNGQPDAVVIVQLHWGAEHTLIPFISQKQQAYNLIDSGADAIIGHHTHTIQTIERYKERPIYYSIGNFIFDQSSPVNSMGLMVKMQISDSEIEFNEIQIAIDKCVPSILQKN